MPIASDSSADILSRTASLPTTTAVSACGWCYVTSVRGSAYQFIFSMEDATNWLQIGYRNTGAFYLASTAGSTNFAANPTTASPFFWWMSCAGTGATDHAGGYAHAGNTFSTQTNNGASFTATRMDLLNDSFAEYMDATLFNVKVWDAVLTQAEFANEMYSGIPRRTANLHLWSPLWRVGDSGDYSGNGRNWTEGGTLVTSAQAFPLTWSYSAQNIYQTVDAAPASNTSNFFFAA